MLPSIPVLFHNSTPTVEAILFRMGLSVSLGRSFYFVLLGFVVIPSVLQVAIPVSPVFPFQFLKYRISVSDVIIHRLGRIAGFTAPAQTVLPASVFSEFRDGLVFLTLLAVLRVHCYPDAKSRQPVVSSACHSHGKRVQIDGSLSGNNKRASNVTVTRRIIPHHHFFVLAFRFTFSMRSLRNCGWYSATNAAIMPFIFSSWMSSIE